MRRKAFTLAEVLIGAMVGLVVLGAATSVLYYSIGLMGRTESHSGAINAERFTMASFQSKVYPKLTYATAIKLINKADGLPSAASLSDDAYVLFLGDGGAVTLRSHGGDFPLPGSEYVSKLAFKLPYAADSATGKEKAAANMLTMTVTVQNSSASSANAPKAEYAASKEIPLFNQPEKEGSPVTAMAGAVAAGAAWAASSAYVGDAVYFETDIKEIDPELIFENLRVLDSKGAETKSATVKKGEKLKAAYDIYFSPSRAAEDVSVLEWYITSDRFAEKVIQTGAWGDSGPSTGYWKLAVDAGTNPLPTAGDFYVMVDGKKQKWPSDFGYIRARVKPALKTSDGAVTEGEPQFSDLVVLIDRSSSGLQFWNDFTDAAARKDKNNADFPIKDDAIEAKGGEYGEITLNGNDSIAGSKIGARVSLKYLKEVMNMSREYSGTSQFRSFTSPTNMSYIVDLKVDSGSSGLGVLLNGVFYRQSASAVFQDSGYMLQYDSGANGFPIRLFWGGVHSANDGGAGDGIKTEYARGTFGMDRVYTTKFRGWNGYYPYTGINRDRTYGPYYGPGYMKNARFDFFANSEAGAETAVWGVRRRFMVTVLEYYMDDPAQPQYIVRMKYLKDESTDSDSDDPLNCGVVYFHSNPIWFGNFKGETINDGGTYSITHKNPSETTKDWKYSYDKNDAGYDISKKSKTLDGVYLTSAQKPFGNESETITGIFRGHEMKIAHDLNSGNYGYKSATSQQNSARSLFTDPKRDRYLGLRIWGGKNGAEGTKIYSMKIAPGFSMKELQAILPAGAKLYNLGDVLQTGDMKTVTDFWGEYGFSSKTASAADVNSILKGIGTVSDGSGNGTGLTRGVNSITYTGRTSGEGAWYGFTPFVPK